MCLALVPISEVLRERPQCRVRGEKGREELHIQACGGEGRKSELLDLNQLSVLNGAEKMTQEKTRGCSEYSRG